MELPNYSVLMSVYKSEKAEYLRVAMNNMWSQTIPTNDFVLVCDGPLTPELDAVIEGMETIHPDLRVIRLKKNGGLGHALQVGVKECKNELIARMDSDDISYPHRCEKQLRVFAAHPELSIVGGIVEEFSFIPEGAVIPEIIDAKRVVPERNKDIIKFAKVRNPFNHPSVMFKKTDVLKAGNYPDIRYIQDYYLWVDMLIAGMKGYNIQEPLVWMRTNGNFFKRRGGKLYAQIQMKLFMKMRNVGFITQTQFLKSVAIRICSASIPTWLRQLVFEKTLRKH